MYIIVLRSLCLVEYTLNPSNWSLHQNFDLNIKSSSPNLPFFFKKLDFKPQSMNESIGSSLQYITSYNPDCC